MSVMPRPAEILLPILRAGLPGVEITTWGADIDHRVFPFINIRRVGGVRHETRPNLLYLPVIEMSAYTDVGLPETEQLYEDALEVLFNAVEKQTLTPVGYLHSVHENMGLTQFSSLYMDSWRVQGLLKFGIRPRSVSVSAS